MVTYSQYHHKKHILLEKHGREEVKDALKVRRSERKREEAWEGARRDSKARKDPRKTKVCLTRPVAA